jgi:hypothetical protein
MSFAKSELHTSASARKNFAEIRDFTMYLLQTVKGRARHSKNHVERVVLKVKNHGHWLWL